MCRLLGIVSSEHTDFRLSLREAPRSLARLSREHPHGWGVAVYCGGSGWAVHKEVACAHDDEKFHQVAAGRRGELLIAHVRRRTVGAVALQNTHPFQRGRWLFAHNGTIEDLGYLRAGTSAHRLGQLHGDTDSELLFSFLLTRLDAAGVADAPADERTDAVLREALREARARPCLGAANFLLSDGDVLYAHRWGRSFYFLERIPGDRVLRERHSDETGAVIETPWSPRRHAVLLASEHITDEPWRTVEEGTLLRVNRGRVPIWRELR